jgi:hypothetical protein
LEEEIHQCDHDRDENEVPDIRESSIQILDDEEDGSYDSHDNPEDVWCPSCFDIGIRGVREKKCSCYQSNSVQECDINHHRHW